MRHKRKIAVGVAVLLALLTVAATYFGTVAVVSTMHGETNYFHIVIGNHAASVVRKISPSNVVDVLEVQQWTFANAPYVSSAVQHYASADTIILDLTYSKTHVITQALASHVSVILSNYAVPGRDFSFFCRGANAATNNNLTWSLAGPGIMRWPNAATNTLCTSNGFVFVSGIVPMANAGMLTNVVINALDE